MRQRRIEVFHAINLLTSANAPLAQSARRLVKYIGEAARNCLESLENIP